MTAQILKTPAISMVAWSTQDPRQVFVAIPNERGRYMKTSVCVVQVACPACEAAIGEPCRVRRGGQWQYNTTVHYKRSDEGNYYRKKHPGWRKDPSSRNALLERAVVDIAKILRKVVDDLGACR